VVESTAVPEPVTHEAQTEFVESQANPVRQSPPVSRLPQDKTLVVPTVQSPQLATIPVYVKDAEFAPVAQLTQTVFVTSHS
jgi:hypothetical protein